MIIRNCTTIQNFFGLAVGSPKLTKTELQAGIYS